MSRLVAVVFGVAFLCSTVRAQTDSVQAVDPVKLAIVGGVTAVGSSVFQTYVEIEDGFSDYWGFDRVDFASDILGAWYPYLQFQYPVLKDFQFRFNYLPKNAGEASASRTVTSSGTLRLTWT